MKTVLFTWNPKKYAFAEAADYRAQLQQGRAVETRWSCGNNRSIEPDDRFFLMKQGVEPRGIVAAGRVRSLAYADDDWKGDGSQFYNDIVFDSLGDPQQGQVIPIAKLLDTDNRPGFWNTPSSGITVPSEVAAEVERKWNQLLRRLQIVPAANTTAEKTSKDWSEREVELIVADYVSMMQAELAGQKYSKTEHRKRLLPLLNGRSEASIEFKHANISAALLRLNQPYIDGYKPRPNFQKSLLDAVEEQLPAIADIMAVPEVRERFEPNQPTVIPADRLRADVIVEAPEEIVLPEPGQAWRSRRGKRVDFAARDAHNRRLGRAGEQFALEVERKRLLQAGRDDLAAKVVWASHEWGDGLGFDVLSFDHLTEAERRIEVKTTSMPKHFPFVVTANEVACSDAEPDHYHLYRVFTFTTDPRLYVVSGSLSARCNLQALAYRAGLKG